MECPLWIIAVALIAPFAFWAAFFVLAVAVNTSYWVWLKITGRE
jgi:hypothetical protein